jgi:hypothetical protein
MPDAAEAAVQSKIRRPPNLILILIDPLSRTQFKKMLPLTSALLSKHGFSQFEQYRRERLSSQIQGSLSVFTQAPKASLPSKAARLFSAVPLVTTAALTKSHSTSDACWSHAMSFLCATANGFGICFVMQALLTAYYLLLATYYSLALGFAS